MKWILFFMIYWTGMPPNVPVQIPMASESLCEEGARKVRQKFLEAAQAMGAPTNPRIVATCLQILN